MPPQQPRGAAAPRRSLLVVLRVTADSNRKNRPAWYDKATCVGSIRLAAERLRERGGSVHLLALVDEAGGALPAPLRAALTGWDEVVDIRGGSARRSWKAMLDHVNRRSGELAEVVYFVEDDHLHAPDALDALTQGDRDYSLLYTLRLGGPERSAGEFRWRPAVAGVSSFAVSRSEYLRSRRLLRAMSSANQAWDDITWATLMGPGRLDLDYVREALLPVEGRPVLHPINIYNLLWRLIGYGWTRLRAPATAWAVDPNLATHAEQEGLAPGTDWAAVAASVPRVAAR